MKTDISGKIVRGKGKGGKLGFPTVNIELREKIESGVYAGSVIVDENKHKAGIFINKGRILLEAYIIGFSGDLYGKEIEIEIGKKIRDVMKFEDDEKLKGQIKKDIETICLQE